MAKAKQQKVSVETYIEDLNKLIANDANPRKIGAKQFEALKKSLRDFPEMKELREIVVDENNVILGGHQRLYALKELGYSNITVKKVTGFTEKQKREFIIKDNNSSGEWDTDILANEWDMDEIADWGVDKFSQFGKGDPDDSEKEKQNKKDIQVVCPACYHEFLLSESAPAE